MSKVIHYRKNCIGCNACCEQARDYWEMDPKDGKVNLKRSEEKKDGVHVLDISEAEVEKNVEAANSCPVRIIVVRDDKGKEIAP